MNPRVIGQLGVKSQSQQVLLPGRHHPLIQPGQHLYALARLNYERSADEDRPVRPVQPLEIQVRLEGLSLCPEGIAADCNVHQP